MLDEIVNLLYFLNLYSKYMENSEAFYFGSFRQAQTLKLLVVICLYI